MRHSSIGLPMIAILVVWFTIGPVGGQDANARAVSGKEFSATVRLRGDEVALEGVLFIPEQVVEVHRVIAVIAWGLGSALYEDADWRELSERTQSGLLRLTVGNDPPMTERTPIPQQAVRNAVVGGGDGLLLLLDRLAGESGHPELRSAKLLLWGHSAAGSFALTFAALHPHRTIGFVRYHSHLRELPVDIESAANVPGLLLAGETDQVAGVEDSRALWQRGRSLAAPWTFGVEPGIPHGTREGLKQANRVALPWVSAVIQLRMPPGQLQLRSVDESSGWLGNPETGSIDAYGAFADVKREASWLPDETSAQGWRVVTGHAR